MIEKVIPVNGIHMYLKEYEKNGDAIVFLHCSRGNHAQWDGIIHDFKEHFYVITPDLRGHGKTDKPTENYTLENIALDIKEMLDNLGIDKAHLVGSSFGGEVGIIFAAMFPERTISLTSEGAIVNLFGPDGSYDLKDDELQKKKEEIIKRNQSALVLYDSLEEALSKQKKLYEMLNIPWNDVRKNYQKTKFIKNDDGYYLHSFPNEMGVELVKAYFDIDFKKYMKDIRCPVLFLPSEDESKDEKILRILKSYEDILHFSKIETINGAIHAEVMLDYPNDFSNTIKSFLKEAL